MNPCISCGLTLPPGSSHASRDDCIVALRAALEAATKCFHCHDHVPVVAHGACFAKIGAGRVGNVLLDKLGERASSFVAEKLSERRARPRRQDEDSDPDEGPRREGGGKRFTP